MDEHFFGLEHRPRYQLGFFPTPLTEMSRLSRHLSGPRILIKRDDLTGLAEGGNKVRKLEFLFGEALSQGADCVLTGGAAQSNHCRQTAAAAALAGLPCHLALGGDEPAGYQGNLLLDRLLGARLHWCGADRKGEQLPALHDALRQHGKTPYIIPYGGSNATGALGFVQAVSELAEQLRAFQMPVPTHLVFASSSGGTHAGLMMGKHLFKQPYQVIGISIDKEDLQGVSLPLQIEKISEEVANILGVAEFSGMRETALVTDYCQAGYGQVGQREREAISLTATLEGILLDPVYTGRAMGGLIDLIRRKVFSVHDVVLFWHTGGTPALYGYADELW